MKSDEPETTLKRKLTNTVSLFVSRSLTSSRVNKTGSWRFARPVYINKTAPCTSVCPAGNTIPRIEMHMSRGEVKEAFDAIMMENPFPAICGRVCFHTCEGACNRAGQDNAIAIRCLERFIGDTAVSNDYGLSMPLLPSNGKTIAIIGAGPAGLSAAYFMTRLGFACEIFESTAEPGGVLRWGIPSYRLPKDILKKEIDRILALGVAIHYNHQMTPVFIDDARKRFDGVFIGSGLDQALSMGIQGESLVRDGLELLMDIQTGAVSEKSGKIAVIGGGNTAVDVARSLKRLGADPVIVYRRRKEDMPAFGHEILATEAEGIEILELMSPLSVESRDGSLVLTVQKMAVGKTGDDGRTSVTPVTGSTEALVVDQVFSGIGATLSDAWTTRKTSDMIRLSHVSMEFGEMPVLAGGDVVNTVQSVADAIASGKQAAIALHAFVEKGRQGIDDAMETCRIGDGNSLSMETWLSDAGPSRDRYVVTEKDINRDYFPETSRTEPEVLPPELAAASFAENEKAYSEAEAVDEAGRCYNCGYCNECDNCRIFCPEISIIRQEGDKVVDMDYCKGCGVCFVECPRSAISMEEEK